MRMKAIALLVVLWLAGAASALEVYFLRHGETTWNRSKVLQGAIAHPDLTDRGVRMAAATGQGFAKAGIRFDRIYASPLRRAFHTAQIVAETAGTGLTPVVDDRLREMCYGRYDGVRYGKDDYPDDNLRRFFEQPESYVPVGPGAESFDAVGARLRAFLNEELLPLDGKVERVLCVAHSLILKTLVRELAGASASDAARKPIQRNCCVHILSCRDGRFMLKETGRLFYDAAAFEAEPAPLKVSAIGVSGAEAVAAKYDVVRFAVMPDAGGAPVVATAAEGGRARLDDMLAAVKTLPQFRIGFVPFSPALAEATLRCLAAADIDPSRVMVDVRGAAEAYFREHHPKVRRVTCGAGARGE